MINFAVVLLFPVIAWYDIIHGYELNALVWLLFPVIAWYDIINKEPISAIKWLLFPVIAWYDIIKGKRDIINERCCSRLSLGMI